MSDRLSNSDLRGLREEPNRGWPSWAVSAAVHALVLILAVLLLNQAPRGAAEEPGRQAGIVLRTANAESAYYEGEQSADTDPAEQSSPVAANSADLLEALPEAAQPGEIESMMPETSGIGAEALAGGAETAGELTSGGAGGRPVTGGGAAHLKVFGVEGVGNKFVFVFDRSVSMDGAPLAAAKRQLMDGINALDSVHQFQIVFFNHDVDVFDITGGQNRIAFASDRNKKLAADYVERVNATGGTERERALKQALGFSPDVIFFLTDADGPIRPQDLVELIRRAQSRGSSISVIEYGSGPAHGIRNFLVELAVNTGGQYGYINTNLLSR